ncbi:MAG: CPBP family glutamic-type intramembrane protease [Cuniculiplasma sp.]
MRSFGKLDLLYMVFFADMTILMVYGMSLLVTNTFHNGGIITTNQLLKDMVVYFYYPPGGILFLSLPLPFFLGAGILFAIYIYIFYYNYRTTERNREETPLETPIGYIVGVGSLIFFVSLILILLQEALGVPITAKGLAAIERTEPVFFYYQLIYAPFVEELEFRILPIGVYLLVRYYVQKKDFKVWQVFLTPGKLMKRFGRKLDRYDWVMIFSTSILFGYAHYAYGDWSLSKIPQAALGGFAFAIGFMLFGPFVDIPMHFLFDGTFTVDIMPGGGLALAPIIIGLVLVFICAVVTIILMLIRYAKKQDAGKTLPPEITQNQA